MTAPKTKPKAKATKPKKAKTPLIRTKGNGNVYDWDAIKLDYFKAEEMEVRVFLREKHGIDSKKSGAVERQLKGWREEKEEIKRKAMEKAKEQLEKVYNPSIQELSEMHKASITIFKAALNKALADCVQDGKVVKMPDIATIERIWKIVKAEKLEPTAVSKNENSISGEDRDLMRKLIGIEFDEDEEDEEDL